MLTLSEVQFWEVRLDAELASLEAAIMDCRHELRLAYMQDMQTAECLADTMRYLLDAKRGIGTRRRGLRWLYAQDIGKQNAVLFNGWRYEPVSGGLVNDS